MSKENDIIQVFIPIAFKRKNGRPKILAPDVDPHFQARVQSPHILRALGRAWSWRRKLETGEAATIQDIAKAEKVSTQFVGAPSTRAMRLLDRFPIRLHRILRQPFHRRRIRCNLIGNRSNLDSLPWPGGGTR